MRRRTEAAGSNLSGYRTRARDMAQPKTYASGRESTNPTLRVVVVSEELIKPDRRITYPDYDVPILEWYDGIFDSVYVALHPFHRIEGHHPNQFDYQTAVHDATKLSTEEVTEMINRPRPPDGRDGHALYLSLAKRDAVPVNWCNVGESVALPDLAATNRALLTTILALKKQFADREGALKLESYCEREELFMPTEGRFQPIMEAGFGTMFRRANLGEVIIADEFYEKTKTVTIESLEDRMSSDLEAAPFFAKKIYPADMRSLVVVDWDSFFILVCAGRDLMENMKPEDFFEGFYCTPATRHDWWNQGAEAGY